MLREKGFVEPQWHGEHRARQQAEKVEAVNQFRARPGFLASGFIRPFPISVNSVSRWFKWFVISSEEHRLAER
jgi:hypothetical protein